MCSLFSDIPREIEKLYETPKYFLLGYDFPGHPASKRTAELIITRLNG